MTKPHNLFRMRKNMIIVAACLLTAVLAVTGCWAITKNNTEGDPTPNQYANTITSPPVPQSLTFAGEEVPLDVYWVHEALDRELVINCYQHSKTLRIIKLSSRIFPVIEKILKEEGVPEDFKYLCVAESGLENVTSPANAGGYWQFIPSTAKIYGLECAVYQVKITMQQKPYRSSIMRTFGAAVTGSPSMSTRAGKDIITKDFSQPSMTRRFTTTGICISITKPPDTSIAFSPSSSSSRTRRRTA